MPAPKKTNVLKFKYWTPDGNTAEAEGGPTACMDMIFSMLPLKTQTRVLLALEATNTKQRAAEHAAATGLPPA